MADIIDINVTETTEQVTINVVNDVIQVNINQVTGGVGGSQNLQQVTDELLVDGFAETTNGIKAREFKTDNFYTFENFGFAYSDDNDGFLNFKYEPYGLGMTFSNQTNNAQTNITDYGIAVINQDDTKQVGISGEAKLYFFDKATNKGIYVNQPTSIVGTDKTITVRDLSGTMAFLSDIPSITNLVPYTGANANVDLGEFELKAGQIELDTTPTGTAGVAVTRWNDSIGSSETILKGGSVVLKNGVDLVARVVNKVTPNTTLTKAAYQVVRISGAQGQRLAVNLAQANNDNNSADTLGIVTETIATNQEGFIMTVGQLEGINTTGSLQGETWADGDVLYLSPTTAGRITNIKPAGATGHIVILGYVEYAHAVNGKIYVKIMNGWELDELHNVFIDTPLNNQALTYETSTELWKNRTIIQDSITDGVTTVAPSQNAVFDALALRKKRVITDTTAVVVSGTTSLTLAKTYELTAGTLSASGFLDVYMFSSRAGNSLIHSMGLYINTTNNFATATLIATIATAGNFTPHLPCKLQYILKDNLLIGGLFSQTSGSNMPNSATRVSVACNNTSASVWLFVGVTPASGQTITLEGVEILN